MKNNLVFALFIIGLPFMSGCSGNKSGNVVTDNETITTDSVKQPTSNYYFNGDLTINDTRATFKDCITNNVMTIVRKGDFKKVEEKYKSLETSSQKDINCAVMGYLVKLNISGDENNEGLVITNLIEFNPSVSCNTANSLVTNNYVRYMPNDKNPTQKTTISFAKDYTYDCVTYQLSPMQLLSRYEGKWHRTDMDNIVLLVDNDVLYEGVIDYSTMNLILENDNEKQVTFKKE